MDLELVALEEIERQPSPAGVEVPRDFYRILRKPAPLAGMPLPRQDFPWSELSGLGFEALARLEPRGDPPALLRVIFDQQLEDLLHGGPPADPAREERLVREVAGLVAETLRKGEGVVVHCAGGTGRTGLVIGCALVALGLEAVSIASYLDRLMRRRGRDGWPESRWQGELLRRFSEDD